jgi:predicted Zn-dependent peptidase
MIALLVTVALAAKPKFVAPPPPEPTPAPAAFVAPTRPRPPALDPRPIVTPPAERGTLSNGIPVIVVTNREVPLFSARLVARVGVDLDPRGREGLVGAAFDLLDEGAGGLDRAAIAAAADKVGGYVSSGAGRDVGQVAVGGPVAHADALLDLWATVIRAPDFPADAWQVAQAKRIADLQARAEDPNAIAGRAIARLTWGEAYAGRLPTEASYAAITTKDLAKLYKRAIAPTDVVVLVGGDVSLAEVQPKLEAALGGWRPKGRRLAPRATPTPFAGEVVHVIDKPGAAQTVILSAHPVAGRQDPAWWPVSLANTMFGGAFTARVNMNLREDKGWTYGARCGLDDGMGPTIWACSTSVQADKTVPALAELRRELADTRGARPFTAEELAFFLGFRTSSLYGAFETPDQLLGELQTIWTYRLPDTWIDDTIPKLEAVSLEAAQAAWRAAIDPGRVAWLLVGDAARWRGELDALGVKVVTLDRDGRPTE